MMFEGYKGGPLMNPLGRVQENMKIQLVDHYAETPAKIAHDLDELDMFIGEHESELYRCTCEDDPEQPRGSYEYDTNAYNHHRDCPSGSAYHYHVLLAGLARHFREMELVQVITYENGTSYNGEQT